MQTSKWLRFIWKAGRSPLAIAFILCLFFSIVRIYRMDIVKDNFLYSIPNESHYFLFISTLSLISLFIFRFINLFTQEISSKKEGVLILVLPVIQKSLKIFLFLLLAKISLPLLNMSENYFLIAQKTFYICIVISFSWILIKVITAWEQIVTQNYLHDAENTKSKAVYTKIHILRKIAIFFIALVALAAIFMQFKIGRELGLSMIASAGLLTVVTGLAAQKTLSTLFLGLRMILTQPIRMGDIIFIEGELGHVEEITLTYVIIRLWNLRSLIVPIEYFINESFQNLTKNSCNLLGTVTIYVDYRIPIDTLRFQFYAFLKQSSLWDGKTAALEVTECKETCLELRLLMSAASAKELWDLRCEIREKFVAYIQNAYPACLPMIRYQTMGVTEHPHDSN